MKDIILIIIVILLIVGLYYYTKNKKNIIVSTLTEINGGVKTGKTFLLNYLGHKDHKQQHNKWIIKKFFQKLLHRKVSEEPLLYSNIPLGNEKEYVALTNELIMRTKRFAYKSTTLINEASLVASSMSAVLDKPIKQEELKKEWEELTDEQKERVKANVNQVMTHLLKLYGHETKGGHLIFDTQCEEDLHYSFRRACSQRYFIVKSNFNLPFIVIFKVKELYSTGDNNINVNTGDIEDNTKMYIAFNKKRVYNMYDCYAYSYLTDNLPVENTKVYNKVSRFKNRHLLKANTIFTLFKSDKLPIQKQEYYIKKLKERSKEDESKK